MTTKKKAVRDLRRTSKDHPRYRERIEREGWVPHVLRDHHGMYWDSFTAIGKSGEVKNVLSEPARQELIKMILDGLFGEEVKDALIDEASYWRIRDVLERRNSATIDRESVSTES